MMTNTYAEIEALYAEKIAPYIGRIKAGMATVDLGFKTIISLLITLVFTGYFSHQDHLHFSGKGSSLSYLIACVMAHPLEFLGVVIISAVIFKVNFSLLYQRYLPFFLWDRYRRLRKKVYWAC